MMRWIEKFFIVCLLLASLGSATALAEALVFSNGYFEITYQQGYITNLRFNAEGEGLTEGYSNDLLKERAGIHVRAKFAGIEGIKLLYPVNGLAEQVSPGIVEISLSYGYEEDIPLIHAEWVMELDEDRLIMWADLSEEPDCPDIEDYAIGYFLDFPWDKRRNDGSDNPVAFERFVTKRGQVFDYHLFERRMGAFASYRLDGELSLKEIPSAIGFTISTDDGVDMAPTIAWIDAHRFPPGSKDAPLECYDLRFIVPNGGQAQANFLMPDMDDPSEEYMEMGFYPFGVGTSLSGGSRDFSKHIDLTIQVRPMTQQINPDSKAADYPEFLCSDPSVERSLNDLLYTHHFKVKFPHHNANGLTAERAWTGMSYGWIDGYFRNREKVFLESVPILGVRPPDSGTHPDVPEDHAGQGYVWAFHSRYDWPFPDDKNRCHYDSNAHYLIGCYQYYMWTRDADFLLENIDEMREALAFYVDNVRMHLPADQPEAPPFSNLLTIRYRNHWGRGRDGGPAYPQHPEFTGWCDPLFNPDDLLPDVASDWYDITPFGYMNAYVNIYYYEALRCMREMESEAEALGDTHRYLPDGQYETLRAAVKSEFTQAFWRDADGRFAACIDVNGNIIDFGYAGINLDAVFYDIASNTQSQAIFDWLDNGESSMGVHDSTLWPYYPGLSDTNIYKYNFAPRMNTLDNQFYHVDNWSVPADPGYSDRYDAWNVQNGGASIHHAFYDVCARAKVDVNKAYQRLVSERSLRQRPGDPDIDRFAILERFTGMGDVPQDKIVGGTMFLAHNPDGIPIERWEYLWDREGPLFMWGNPGNTELPRYYDNLITQGQSGNVLIDYPITSGLIGIAYPYAFLGLDVERAGMVVRVDRLSYLFDYAGIRKVLYADLVFDQILVRNEDPHSPVRKLSLDYHWRNTDTAAPAPLQIKGFEPFQLLEYQFDSEGWQSCVADADGTLHILLSPDDAYTSFMVQNTTENLKRYIVTRFEATGTIDRQTNTLIALKNPGDQPVDAVFMIYDIKGNLFTDPEKITIPDHGTWTRTLSPLTMSCREGSVEIWSTGQLFGQSRIRENARFIPVNSRLIQIQNASDADYRISTTNTIMETFSSHWNAESLTRQTISYVKNIHDCHITTYINVYDNCGRLLSSTPMMIAPHAVMKIKPTPKRWTTIEVESNAVILGETNYLGYCNVNPSDTFTESVIMVPEKFSVQTLIAPCVYNADYTSIQLEDY
ncbi:hypothetical protein JW979_00115, partial [bacterium]|nr:hypothetical protein [candidate division CSSED10-310 bacterium]